MTPDNIPFIIANQSQKNELLKLQKVIRALVQLCDGVKKGPGRPSHSPKSISQRLGIVSAPLDNKNLIEAEIHYPEAFQKFISGVLKSSSVNHVCFYFLKDRMLIFGDSGGGASRLEMDINCNRLLRYYCGQQKLVCVQRDFFDVIKTSNGKVHSRIYIYVKKASQDENIFITTDVGNDKGSSSDTKMGLSQIISGKEMDLSMVDQHLQVTIPSQLLKNEISSSQIANQTDFIVKRQLNDDTNKWEYVPLIRTCNSMMNDSNSLEKTMTLQDDNQFKIFKQVDYEVRIKSSLFRQYVSMMSKFASSIKIYVGRVKDAEEPTDVVIFEMQCDNEENNIFCVTEEELHGKISHLYGYDYICRCYCFNKSYLCSEQKKIF